MSKKETKDKDIISLSKVKPIEFISSGVAELDELTGGYPKGRVTHIAGLSSVGKTHLMINCLIAVSKTSKILYCDVENAMNIERAKELGADLDNIDYSSLSVLEEVCDLIANNLSKYDLIVLDSIAMMTPRAEHEGEIGQALVGLKPRLIGTWLRKITKDLADSGTALVLVNQLRRTMELWSGKYVYPGGLQLKFSSSLMLELNTTAKDRIIKSGNRAGHWVNISVTKNKVGKPYGTTRFRVDY